MKMITLIKDNDNDLDVNHKNTNPVDIDLMIYWNTWEMSPNNVDVRTQLTKILKETSHLDRPIIV